MTWRDCGELDACARLLAPGSLMYVSHVPGQAWTQTVSTCVAVRAAGLEPVPHVPVRELTDEVRCETSSISCRTSRSDPPAAHRRRPRRAGGPFAETLDVLGSGILARQGIRQVTVAGHPEGHPRIAAAELRRAEREKIAWAATVADRAHIRQPVLLRRRALPWLGARAARAGRARAHRGRSCGTRKPLDALQVRAALRCRALGARPRCAAGRPRRTGWRARSGERGPRHRARCGRRPHGAGRHSPILLRRAHAKLRLDRRGLARTLRTRRQWRLHRRRTLLSRPHTSRSRF